MKYRLWQLDVLRCLAVLLVMFRHLDAPPVQYASLYSIRTMLATGGWIGVDLFFVLSGFLVSGLIFNEYKSRGRFAAGRFLIRRGLKIYPAFWVLIACTLGMKSLTNTNLSASGIVHELLFIQNYLPGLWNHTWSLAVEEHFYLVLTAVCFFIFSVSRSSSRIKSLPVLCVLVMLGCLLLRLSTNGAFSHYNNTFPTHLRVDSLMFGVLISYGFHFTQWLNAFNRPNVRRCALVIGVAMIVPFFYYKLGRTDWIHTYGFSVLYVAFGLILLSAKFSPAKPNAIGRLMAKIGVYSYSIYLWHLAADDWGPQIFSLIVQRPPVWWEYGVGYFAGSVILGIIMAKLIEQPVLALRDRLWPSVRSHGDSANA